MSDIPTSGAISLNQMHTEVDGASGSIVSINDADIRGLIGKGSGATMSFSEWWGASNSIDTQSLVVGTVTPNATYTGTYIGASQGGQHSASSAGTWTTGSMSDGTCNFKSGAYYRGLYWQSTYTYSSSTKAHLNIAGTHSNSGWTSLNTGTGTTLTRSSMSYATNSFFTTTTWQKTNPPAFYTSSMVGQTKTVTFQ
jgi:hypothetical protein